MKKYYLIEIARGDAKIVGKSIYEYDSLKLAIANFHKKLGTAMSSDLYTEESLMIIDVEGGVYKQEYYNTVEPEETEETPTEDTEG